MTSTFVLPDFCNDWPFKATLNPHHEAASAESVQWVESFHTFDHKAQAAFNRCKFPLVASLAHSDVGLTHLRLACDLINWFFVFDELSDIKDGHSTRELAASLIDVFRDPSRPSPAGKSALGEMTKCFWSRILEFSSPSSAQRVLESLCLYVQAVCQEAEDREHGHVGSINDYLALRRATVGVKASFEFNLLQIEISQDIITHPRIEDLTRAAVDIIILVNDVYSYNYERAHGLDGHNIVTAVMKEKDIDVQGAMNDIGGWFRDITTKFVQDCKDIPSFSPSIDQIVAQYISGMANWVPALIEWSFESERYFGIQGPKIKLTRVVELRSRESVALN